MKKNLAPLFFFLLCGMMNAHPMAISFNEMIKQSKTICIAKFLDEYNYESLAYNIGVEEVLKGKQDTGKLSVTKAYGTPQLKKGERFIAFINESGALEWGGTADDPEKDLIQLQGYYDYNAYFVSPGGLTLVQLKQYLAENKFTGELNADLEFFDYEKQVFEKSQTSFHCTFTYDDSDKETYDLKSTGLTVVDFKGKPEFSYDGSGIQISYEENMVRPLQFDGIVDSIGSGGHYFHCQVSVSEPENLDMKMFYEYVAHPEYGPLWYELQVTLEDSTKYTIVEDIEMGRIGYIIYGKDSIECNAGGGPSRTDTSYYIFGGYDDPLIRISLDCLPQNDPRFKDYTGESDLYLIPALRMTNYTGRFYVREKNGLMFKGNCTISLKAIHFGKNENWKGK
ncbi:MAG: hypothetical protein HY064_07735 [Bacteroidetes bacterium]|nr:hypothetical protein [Bacteroidota bacterium]